ncbi:MAG: hypothetical protein JWM05_2623 [Acidimicrobiales bacterium]|nr:hypothetical protein [Acidimicrobiales bacterium]
MLRGTLTMLGRYGEIRELYLFDDAFVVSPNGKTRVGPAFGVVGVVASAIVDKHKASQHPSAGPIDPNTATGLAAALPGCELVPWTEVAAARLRKGLRLARTVTFVTNDGRSLRLPFNDRQQPTVDVDAALRVHLGARLTGP